MKTLEQEARECSERYFRGDELDDQICGVAMVSFEAGANSKWVQIEKIKAQIEILEVFEYSEHEYLIYVHDTLQTLRLQLKQLEDGN